MKGFFLQVGRIFPICESSFRSKRLKVDDIGLDETDYKLESGSTILTIKHSFSNTYQIKRFYMFYSYKKEKYMIIYKKKLEI